MTVVTETCAILFLSNQSIVHIPVIVNDRMGGGTDQWIQNRMT